MERKTKGFLIKPLLAIAAFALIWAAPSAGTVTLTGSCPVGIISGPVNYTTFTLSNSGNQTASGLVIVPRLSGAGTYNSAESIQYLPPAQNVSERFYLYNFSVPGGYSESFVVEYAQGSSEFYALFPCLMYFGNRTQSLTSIESINQSGNTITVSIVNLAQYPINASVSLMVPPEFQASPAQLPAMVQPGSMANFSFSLRHQQLGSASYTIAAAVSYLHGGMHYSSLEPHVLSFYASSGPSFLSKYLIFLVIAFVLVIIAGLIAVSMVKGGRRGADAPSQGGGSA